jgi:hypothetical protein
MEREAKVLKLAAIVTYFKQNPGIRLGKLAVNR